VAAQVWLRPPRATRTRNDPASRFVTLRSPHGPHRPKAVWTCTKPSARFYVSRAGTSYVFTMRPRRQSSGLLSLDEREDGGLDVPGQAVSCGGDPFEAAFGFARGRLPGQVGRRAVYLARDLPLGKAAASLEICVPRSLGDALARTVPRAMLGSTQTEIAHLRGSSQPVPRPKRRRRTEMAICCSVWRGGIVRETAPCWLVRVSTRWNPAGATA